MIGNIFNSKNNALNELLEVINKGVDLLGKDTTNTNVLDAWKKYAISTLELIDSTFNTSYSIGFSYENDVSPFGYRYNNLNDITSRHISDLGLHSLYPTTINMSYWDFSKNNELQKELQKLIAIAKRLPKE